MQGPTFMQQHRLSGWSFIALDDGCPLQLIACAGAGLDEELLTKKNRAIATSKACVGTARC